MSSRRRPLIRGLMALGALSLLMLPSAHAAETPHARVSLVSEVGHVTAGKPFTIALAFELDPEWHLYWKDPGDSGMPPSVKWTLPEGYKAGELQFPKPEVLKTPAGTNYVYHSAFALLVEITPPADVKADAPVEIKADVKWLECDPNMCVPGKQSASLTIGGATAPNADVAEKFKSWRTKVAEGATFDPKAAE